MELGHAFHKGFVYPRIRLVHLLLQVEATSGPGGLVIMETFMVLEELFPGRPSPRKPWADLDVGRPRCRLAAVFEVGEYVGSLQVIV